MYWDYSEALNQIKPHRILAINRGEREEKLEVTIDVDLDGAIDLLKKRTTINNKYHGEAIEEGVVRLLSPAVVREIRGVVAEGEGVGEKGFKAAHEASVRKRSDGERGKRAEHAVFRFAHPLALVDKEQLVYTETQQRQQTEI